MKKILYISNFFDGTGYSHAAIGYIRALETAGYDVAIRNLKLNNRIIEQDSHLIDLTKKSATDCSVVIQHVLPHMMEYCGQFKRNIGLFVHEMDSFGVCPWGNYLNLMDELIVPNTFMKQTLCKNLSPTTHLVPHTCDLSIYSKEYPKLNIPELQDKFVFYFVGENIRRKNIAGLLKAFHLEFSLDEPVALLIKTTMPGLSPEQCGQKMNEFCTKVKSNLKLYKNLSDYHREIIITDFISENDMMSIHRGCDVFVNMSYAESFCIPILDSMGCGKPVISNDCGGPHDILQGGLLVENQLEPAFGCIETFGDLNTGRENWWNPNMNAARKYMRQLYEDKNFYQQMSEFSLQRVKDFSYEHVGEIFRKVLEDQNV